MVISSVYYGAGIAALVSCLVGGGAALGVYVQRKKGKRPKLSVAPSSRDKSIMQSVYQLLESDEYYTEPDFSMTRLAELIGVNPVYLSNAINRVEHKNYCVFINEWRVRTGMRLLSDERLGKYAIEEIALRSGFHTRQSFYVAFKRYTGISPANYRKHIEEAVRMCSGYTDSALSS
jgi:AraC-like DNA-binding protein